MTGEHGRLAARRGKLPPHQPIVPGHFIHVILGRDPSGVWAVA